ncbi:hypothetical protein K2173_010551 [Erythroxylum novogranatense]|uniref:Uncharacterized protein n=1 Tax=Erythroxylum novogranatense TaxID=1862640 RepID=A0AAV8TED5_9ROSI|nr:hypothetical protein K2173_010551 [Erythroxylum novogranatense]
MCCGCRICMLCVCLIAVVILIGLLFGFGVFNHGFHKLKDAIHVSDHPSSYYYNINANG